MDEIIYNMELDYTIKDILTAVNLIAADTYNEIKFVWLYGRDVDYMSLTF